MNDRYAQETSQRTRPRSRWLAIATATAVSIAVATAGAGGASADDLRLDDDILPPVGQALPQGLSAQAVPADPGFARLSFLVRNTPQLRKAYTFRLVGAESEPMRSAAVFAAQQIEAIGDVTITVAPGTIPEPGRGNAVRPVPADGEILLAMDTNYTTCSAFAAACAQVSGSTWWSSQVVRLDSGRMWIRPEISNRSTDLQRTVVAHELGHTLGLGHYDQEYKGQLQLMNPYAQEDTGGVYRAGDKNGIKFVSPPPSQFALRNDNPTWSASRNIVPETVFAFGQKGDIPLKGDWTGDGTDTPGVYRPSAFLAPNFSLRDSNTPGPADAEFSFPDWTGSRPGDIPIVGDWNGYGFDTVGILRGDTFYLQNITTPVPSFTSFTLPDLTAKPLGADDRVLVGDWDGDGIDTIAIRRGYENRSNVRGSWWSFYHTNSSSTSVTRHMFGAAFHEPVVGDWDGDGTDGVGVRYEQQWYLWNALYPTGTLVHTSFGESGDTPLPGDWDGNGTDTLGTHLN